MCLLYLAGVRNLRLLLLWNPLKLFIGLGSGQYVGVFPLDEQSFQNDCNMVDILGKTIADV
jgi:hypothetical protein